MNSDIQPVKNNTLKHENLKKGQIYKRNNTDDLQVVLIIILQDIKNTKNNVKVHVTA